MESTTRRDIRLEIDLIRCANVFSESPCTAVLGDQGRCYNTFRTCQDTDNFIPRTQTLVLVDEKGGDIEAGAIPCIDRVTIRNQTLNPDSTPRFNTEARVVIKNFNAPDQISEDPYSRRSEAGTWWGRLFQRDPYIVNYRARLTTLVHGITQTTHWIVHTFEVPSDTGTFTLTLSDPLRVALQDEFPEDDNATLAGNLLRAATTTNALPSGLEVGTEVSVEDEIIRISTANADGSYTIERGRRGTEDDSHDQGSEVQSVYIAPAGTHLLDLLRDILLQSGVDAEYIDPDFWEMEKRAGFSFHILDEAVVIPEPLRLSTILQNFVLLGPVALYWNPITAKIEPIAQTPFIDRGRPLTGEDFVDDPRIRADQSLHKTQVILRFGPPNPTERSELRRRVAALDLAAQNEIIYGRAYVRDHKLELVPRGARNLVSLAAQRLLSRYGGRNGFPKTIECSVPMALYEEYPIGTVCPITVPRMTLNDAGEDAPIEAQVLNATPNFETGRLQLRMLQYIPTDLNAAGDPIIDTSGTLRLSSRAAVDLFFVLGAPDFDLDYRVIVQAGSTLSGLRDTDEPALLIRNFTAGSNITVEVQEGARILGYGGIGGLIRVPEGDEPATPSHIVSGGTGGVAVEIRDTNATISLVNEGLIAGGGGGGGVAFQQLGADGIGQDVVSEAGGGGGAGSELSPGGLPETPGLGGIVAYLLQQEEAEENREPANEGRIPPSGGTPLLGGAGGTTNILLTGPPGPAVFTIPLLGGRGGDLAAPGTLAPSVLGLGLDASYHRGPAGQPGVAFINQSTGSVTLIGGGQIMGDAGGLT